MSDIELQELVINEAESDEVVEQQTELPPNQIIVTPTGSSGADYYGLPVGSIFASAIPIVDARVHLLDGSLITQSGIYAEFATLIKTLVSSGQPISCTQAEFTADVARTGNCGKFVIDDTNNAIRLPKITTFIQGLTDISNIGSSVSAGLPNITGKIGNNDGYGNQFLLSHYNNINGAFKNTPIASSSYYSSDKTTGTSATAWSDAVTFDASQSNSIYGNSETVQPNATQYPYYIVLASGYKSSEVVDFDNIMNEVNSKLSKNDLYLKYPVGSLYISTNPTSPADAVVNGGLGGGIWEQLPEGLALWTTQSEITNEDTVVEPNASNASASRMLYSGLPNITGQFSFTDDNSTDMRVRTGYCGGAFYSINSTSSKINSNGTPSSTTNGGDVGINASRSSDRYGKSSIVQPPAYKVYAWKRVG